MKDPARLRPATAALALAGLALGAAALPAAARAQTTAPPDFTVPLNVQPGRGAATGADLSMNPDGLAALVTTDRDPRAGAVGVLVSFVDTRTGRLSKVFRFRGGVGARVLDPKIDLGRSDLATVAWSEYIGSGHARTKAVRCTPTGCGPVQVVGRGKRVKTMPAPATDSRGRSFVLWRGVTSHGTERLQWSLSTNGRFHAVHTLGEYGIEPVAAASPSGDIDAMWVSARREGGMRFAERANGNAEFDPPGTLGSPTDLTAEPQLAIQGADGVVAAWRTGGLDGEGQPGAGAIHVAIRRPGAVAFDAPSLVDTSGARDLSLAVNADGRAILAWGDVGTTPAAQATTAAIRISVREPGGVFGVPETLDPDTLLYTPPSAAIDATGRTTVAWTRTAADPATTPPVLRVATGGISGSPEPSGVLDTRPPGCTGAQCGAPGMPLAGGGGTTSVVAWPVFGGWKASVRQ